MNEKPMKLLIVEDEENTRNLLRIILDWKALGIEIVGGASTGAEALSLTEELLPDIVLTDIEMPYMDGITLSERILSRYSDISVVILTAHERFQYVQQALKAGVSDYLLKPLTRDALEKTMSALIERIQSRRALLGRVETSYKYVRDHHQVFKDFLLCELTHRGLVEGLGDVLETVGVQVAGKRRFSLGLISIQNDGMSTFLAQKYFLLINCRAYLEETYNTNGNLHVFIDGLDNIAILCDDDRIDLADVCNQVANYIGSSLFLRLFFGVSDPGYSADDLRDAHAQAWDSLRLALVSDSRSVDERAHDLLLYVKSGMSERAGTLASVLLRQSCAPSETNMDAAKLFAFGFLARATEALAKLGLPWLTLTMLIMPYYTRLLEQQTHNSLDALFVEQIESLCKLAADHHQQQTSETVSRVMMEIDEHYANPDLSLSYVARKFSVNSSYLSRVFKRHTNKPFSEYLMETRISKACELLSQGSGKAYLLAELVGIPDPNYFTKCFKKVTGVTFQNYKSGIATL